MRARFTLPGLVYLALALGAVAGVLYATIRIYTDAGRDLPDIFSACIGHSAATLGVFAFVGATDMFFRFEETKERVEERREWQDELRKAREASDARLNKALEEWRADREYERAQREQERARQEQERQEERARRDQERQEERARQEQERQEARARQEQERQRQEQERQRQEQERQQFISLAEQNQQLLAGLMAQNLELNNRLLNLLERRNGTANGNGASETPDAG